jgi:hypothetical protein
MKKIKYNSTLDQDQKLQKQAEYYDEADLEDAFATKLALY